MEQHIFMQYKHKVKEGSTEKVNRRNFKDTNDTVIKIFLLV